jgi:hypothetical protein
MHRTSAVAICGALLVLAPCANAQTALIEGARVQAGYIHETRPATPAVDDLSIGVLPELTLLSIAPRTRLSLTYALAGILHSFYASEIDNSLTLQAAFDVSKRTTLTLSAYAAQTTLNNYLLTQPAATTGAAIAGGTTVITTGVGQALSYELSPRVRVDELTSATYFKTLPPSVQLDSFNGTLGGSIERSWVKDGLGLEATAGYSNVNATAPTPDQSYVLGTLAPRWRHDWSRTVSSLVAAGASALLTPDGSADPLVLPFARGSLLYTPGDSTFELVAATGITPNLLTGQTLQSTDVSLRALTPISTRAQLFLVGSVGYSHGNLVDRVTPANQYGFDSGLGDAELLWQVSPYVQLFGHYSIIAQDAAIDASAIASGFTPSFVRNSFLLGIALFSRSAAQGGGGGGGGAGGAPDVETRFPQRVDRTDSTLGGGGEEAPRDQAQPPPRGGATEGAPEDPQFYTPPEIPTPPNRPNPPPEK